MNVHNSLQHRTPLQKSIDLINTFVCGKQNGNIINLGIESDLFAEYESNRPNYVLDVDSYFLLCDHTVPLQSKTHFDLMIRPNFDYNIKTKTGVIQKSRHYNRGNGFDISLCPNLNIARAHDCNVS